MGDPLLALRRLRAAQVAKAPLVRPPDAVPPVVPPPPETVDLSAYLDHELVRAAKAVFGGEVVVVVDGQAHGLPPCEKWNPLVLDEIRQWPPGRRRFFAGQALVYRDVLHLPPEEAKARAYVDAVHEGNNVSVSGKVRA